MDNTIKSLTITGTAIKDAMKPRRSARPVSRKKHQDVPDDNEPMENAKRIVFGKAPDTIQPMVQAKPMVQAIPMVQAMVQPKPDYIPLEGGNVILKPPKNPRVKLQPKLQPSLVNTNQTRKARRIHLINLTHRFTRAKRVHADTGNKSMDTIREYLIQKGVIQVKSKAPEKMLRSMYSDFMLLKDQAL